MDGIRLSRINLFFVLLLMATAYGCGSPIQSSKNSAPPFTSGRGGSGIPAEGDDPVDAAGFFMSLTSNTAEVTLHRANVDYATANVRNDANTTNFSTSCRIANDAVVGDIDILCIAEVEELDLYFSEMKLQYHVPPSMCSYVTFMPYHYYAFEPGVGPSITSHEEDNDGNITDVINTDNGVPSCIYDYTGIGGPNCCTGKYSQVVTVYDGDGVPTTTITPDVEWGGANARCLSGPAMTPQWATYRNNAGFPIRRMEYVEGIGFNGSFTIEAAIKSKIADRLVLSSVWAANFYNPSDHVGGPGTVTAPLDVNRPVALRIPPNADTSFMPTDTYVATCYNRAEEISSRIRLMIREWNTNPIAEGGDSDVDGGGTDPNFPDSDLNDRADWLDFGLVYPASSM